MRYNSSEQSDPQINQLIHRRDKYMELAQNEISHRVVNYFINNTICCFYSREFCRAEHQQIYDWLTRPRQHHKPPKFINSYRYCSKPESTKPIQNYSYYVYYYIFYFYHRHRRRPSEIIVKKPKEPVGEGEREVKGESQSQAKKIKLCEKCHCQKKCRRLYIRFKKLKDDHG